MTKERVVDCPRVATRVDRDTLKDTGQLESSHGEFELGLDPCPRLVVILAINSSPESLAYRCGNTTRIPLHRKISCTRES